MEKIATFVQLTVHNVTLTISALGYQLFPPVIFLSQLPRGSAILELSLSHVFLIMESTQLINPAAHLLLTVKQLCLLVTRGSADCPVKYRQPPIHSVTHSICLTPPDSRLLQK